MIEQSPDAAEAALLDTGELPPIQRDPSRPVTRPRFRPIGLTLKVVVFAGVFYFLLLPLIPGFRSAATEITKVEPAFLVGGLALQVAAWFTYSLLTRSALGEAAHQISRVRMFRIQMSTKALGNIVPGGSAASSALGYRLMTLSGIQRTGRRLRTGDRRARLGRRAQRDLLGGPARVDPAAWRQPAVRDGGAGRTWDHGRRRPARPRLAARPGTGRDVPALARRQAALRPGRPRPRPCAASASASRS